MGKRKSSGGKVANMLRAMDTFDATVAMTWQDRALYLVGAHGDVAWRNTQTVAWDTDGLPSQVTVEVASQSIAGLWYPVRYHVNEDSAQCACISGSYHQACYHAGIAIREGRAVVAQHRAAVACELADHWRDEFTADALLRGL